MPHSEGSSVLLGSYGEGVLVCSLLPHPTTLTNVLRLEDRLAPTRDPESESLVLRVGCILDTSRRVQNCTETLTVVNEFFCK